MLKARALYGYDATLSPLRGRTAEEQVELLLDWGVNAVFGGHDRPAFAHAAHRAGLQVMAEFGCFAGERWWHDLPESRPVLSDGSPLEPEEGYYGVNPAHPVVRRKQLLALEKLAQKSPLDGIWLDFVRWPCHWEVSQPRLVKTSFDSLTVARFSDDTGVAVSARDADAILSSHAEIWYRWRCRQIVDWVARARSVLDRVRPGMVMGAFVVPWTPEDHDGALVKIVGQDLPALSKYVDVFSPMGYHRMCGQPPSWIQRVTESMARETDRPVWPTIQSVDHPDALPPAEYGEAIEVVARSAGAEGLIVFTMAGALQGDKLGITERVLPTLA